MAYNATTPEAANLGLAAWTMDPATAIVSQAFATTVIYLSMLWYKPEFDVSPLPLNVFLPNGVAGTSSAFQVGLVNVTPISAGAGTGGQIAAGTLLASSPAAGTISAGLNRFTLTYIAGITALQQAAYWIAMLNTTGTTTTGAAAANPGAANLGANMGTTTANLRFATNGTGASLPASFTLSSNAAAGAGLCFCAGLG
jgi:hypothetical protein